MALIESDLPCAELAAIPETYSTAWTCLFRNLEIAEGQTLVIRAPGLSNRITEAEQLDAVLDLVGIAAAAAPR